MCGAATNPDAHVFAYAAAQVKKALEVTHELGGDGYTFWGGREGYETLLNTNLKREQEHLARFLHMAVDYARQIGFKGQFYIEPKPKEPTKHQYDFDVASGIAFLRTFGLEKHLKFNIETNHATLAGHTFQHEIEVAASQGLLGVGRRERGRHAPRLGHGPVQHGREGDSRSPWSRSCARAASARAGSTSTPSCAARPSTRRTSSTRTSGAWTPTPSPSRSPAGSSRTASSTEFLAERYSSYDSGFGREIEKGAVGFRELEKLVLAKLGEPAPRSGRQEYLENMLNRYLTGG